MLKTYLRLAAIIQFVQVLPTPVIEASVIEDISNNNTNSNECPLYTPEVGSFCNISEGIVCASDEVCCRKPIPGSTSCETAEEVCSDSMLCDCYNGYWACAIVEFCMVACPPPLENVLPTLPPDIMLPPPDLTLPPDLILAPGVDDIQRVRVSLDSDRSLCLNVPNKVSQGVSDSLKIWTCNSRERQQFDYDITDFTLRSVIEPDKCLTLKGNPNTGKVNNGSPVLVQDCVVDSTSNGRALVDATERIEIKQQQQWLFIPNISSNLDGSIEASGKIQSLWRQKKCIKGDQQKGQFVRVVNCEKGDQDLLVWYLEPL